jgi:hypothetical protein
MKRAHSATLDPDRFFDFVLEVRRLRQKKPNPDLAIKVLNSYRNTVLMEPAENAVSRSLCRCRRRSRPNNATSPALLSQITVKIAIINIRKEGKLYTPLTTFLKGK